jgi:glycosyltransferase involved in cell wall biosynthesis
VSAERPVVAFYSNPSSLGGSEIYLQRILEPLLDEDWDFVFFGGDRHPLRDWLLETGRVRYVPLGPIGLIPVEVREQGVAQPTAPPSRPVKSVLRRLVPDSLKLLLGTARQVLQLRRLFIAHPVDLLHFNDTGCEPATIAARLARVPRVTGTFHVAPATDAYSTHWVRRLTEWLSVRMLHGAIAVSRSTRDAWIERTGLRSAPIDVIYNGIDVESYSNFPVDRAAFLTKHGLDPEGRYVVVPARLHWMKGHEVLLRAIASQQDALNGVVFLMVGDGDLRDRLEAEATGLGISKFVRFIGFSTEVRSWLFISEIAVLPSFAEAFGLALLEAMAMGRAVVSTHVGGIPELVQHGCTGFLVSPGDSDALGKAIVKLLSTERLAKDMGDHAKQRAASLFSANSMVGDTRKFFSEAVS